MNAFVAITPVGTDESKIAHCAAMVMFTGGFGFGIASGNGGNVQRPFAAIVPWNKTCGAARFVIWTSEPIPGAPIVYRRDLPEDLKAKIRVAFGKIHNVPWGPKSTIKRWVPVTDSDYDVIRETARLLGLDLKKMK